MSSIQYKPLSELMEKFKDIEDDLYEEFRSSDLSWGSEKQKTLASYDYIYDIIDEYLQGKVHDLVNMLDSESVAELGKYKKLLATLERVRNTPTLCYCMEE